jgi:hypothetical protein
MTKILVWHLSISHLLSSSHLLLLLSSSHLLLLLLSIAAAVVSERSDKIPSHLYERQDGL